MGDPAKLTWKAWLTDDADEPDEPNYRELYDAGCVAEAHAERRYSDCDCPEHMKVSVRGPDGVLHKFDVEAEPTVDFHASEEK